MNILLISSYPSDFEPQRSRFVYSLVQELSRQGAHVEVVSPQAWWKGSIRLISEPGPQEYGPEAARVLRPTYLHLPNRFRMGVRSLGSMNARTYTRAVAGSLQRLQRTPDVVYAHFLYKSGPAGLLASERFGVPSVVALGESNPAKHEKLYTRASVKLTAQAFSGIISVSDRNKRYCVDVLDVPPSRIVVIPNAVDTSLFFPRERAAMRVKHGLPKDKKLVVFTGHFIERKGPLRLMAALDRLPDDVCGIFLGAGPQRPQGEKVVFAESVPHEQVPELLSAADLFVLPTLDEGSSNAIAEAVACGLPIVSSDIEAVREQLGPGHGTLVDPRSSEDLANAIAGGLHGIGRRAVSQRSGNPPVWDLRRRATVILSFLARLLR